MTAVLFSIHLHAQIDTSGKILDEAIVSANKFEQKQSQTGKVVSVISKEELEKSNGKTVTQLLNEQAGIIVNGSLNAPGTVQTVYMRGASSGRVLILVDGIPVGDPSMINNEFDLNFIATQDIERIEIVRGAQSTVYGSDAIAGIINIITIRKNINKPVNAKITAVLGNRETFKSHASIFGRLNKFSYNARFNFLHTKGFSSAYDSTGSKGFDRDGMEGDMENLRLQYNFTDALKAYAWTQRSRYDAGIDMSIFLDEKDYRFSHTHRISGTGLQFKKGRFDIKTNYQKGKTNRQFLNDSGFVSLSGIKFERNFFNAASDFFELYGNIKITNWLSLLAGTDYRKVKMDQVYTSISSFGPYNSYFNDTSVNQVSGYLAVFTSFFDKKLNVEAGIRMNDHSKYGSNSTYTINPSYSITPHFNVFASIATGFKSPSLYQLYDGFSGNPDLKPEKSINHEGGLSYHTEKFNARLVYFKRDIDDGIDFNYTTFKFVNFIEQKVEGLEIEIRVQPTKRWNLTANYTLISGEEKTQSRRTFNDTSYSYLLRRPKHSVNISSGLHVTPKFYLSANLKFVSSRFDTGGYSSKDVKLDNYTLINAYAEYKLKRRVKLFFDLQNITDKRFFDIRGYNSIPFTVSGGASLEL